jgi:hypothetical protein
MMGVNFRFYFSGLCNEHLFVEIHIPKYPLPFPLGKQMKILKGLTLA